MLLRNSFLLSVVSLLESLTSDSFSAFRGLIYSLLTNGLNKLRLATWESFFSSALLLNTRKGSNKVINVCFVTFDPLPHEREGVLFQVQAELSLDSFETWWFFNYLMITSVLNQEKLMRSLFDLSIESFVKIHQTTHSIPVTCRHSKLKGKNNISADDRFQRCFPASIPDVRQTLMSALCGFFVSSVQVFRCFSPSLSTAHENLSASLTSSEILTIFLLFLRASLRGCLGWEMSEFEAYELTRTRREGKNRKMSDVVQSKRAIVFENEKNP